VQLTLIPMSMLTTDNYEQHSLHNYILHEFYSELNKKFKLIFDY
jgi:hypothetical protein